MMFESMRMRSPDPLSNGRAGEDEAAPVWVLDDPAGDDAGQAIALAGRLGVPHLRVPLTWRWTAAFAGGWPGTGSLRGLPPGAHGVWPYAAPRGPAVVLSAGARSEPVALWLRRRFGCRAVHCTGQHWGLHEQSYDLLVMPRHQRPPQRPNVLPVLGLLNTASPLALAQARVAWAGRLAHMPRPLVALLVGGPGREEPWRGHLPPQTAHRWARTVAGMAAGIGGSVVAATSRDTSEEAASAVAAGLSDCMNQLYRHDEPGSNPYEAFIGLADAIVVVGRAPMMLSEACGGEAPVFTAGGPPRDAMAAAFYRAGQARPLQDGFVPWARAPLDEAGRVAQEIRARMSIGSQAVD